MSKPEELKVVSLVGVRGTILRPVMQSDIPLAMKWMNDPEVSEFLNSHLPLTLKNEEEWYNGVSSDKNQAVFIIVVKDCPIGIMGIHRINWFDRTATTGAVIGEKEYWGKGYGTDAKMILLDYAFNTLNLRKIFSSVIAFNKRSLQYSLHCGYVLEGRGRQEIFRKGRYWDRIILGLFKREWLPHWRSYKKKFAQ
ncbi:MAG: N-acetyltransferase [Candidatus Taylorbacteria bacterium]|nr:N-acetyltransferase [Candidatus Taylorbacteria bacterium]